MYFLLLYFCLHVIVPVSVFLSLSLSQLPDDDDDDDDDSSAGKTSAGGNNKWWGRGTKGQGTSNVFASLVHECQTLNPKRHATTAQQHLGTLLIRRVVAVAVTKVKQAN